VQNRQWVNTQVRHDRTGVQCNYGTFAKRNVTLSRYPGLEYRPAGMGGASDDAPAGISSGF